MASRTRIAFGSCNKHDKPQPAWARIAARQPDVFAWLGDVMYADKPVFLKLRIPASAERVAELYVAQKAHPEYAAFEAAMGSRIVGVYDDHDYGINDGDKHYNATARRVSPGLLLDFLNEPLGTPRRARAAHGEGVFASYIYGTAPRRVKLILLDNRTNRDAYDAVEEDMLGPAQWAWLEAQLTQDRTEVTIIGAGLQVLARGDPAIAENWSRMPGSQAKLVALLARTNTTGAFFISGDVHYSEVNRLTCDAVGYPLYDFTSSGLTHSWGGRIKRTVVETALMAATRVESLFDGTNWGEIDVDWEGAQGGGTLITFRSWGIEDDSIHINVTVPLASLQPRWLQGGRVRRRPLVGYAPYLANGRATPQVMNMTIEQAIEICAHAPPHADNAAACDIVMASCSPGLTYGDAAKYYVGHAVIFGAIGAVLLQLLGAPIVACLYGHRVPGGRLMLLSLIAAVYAAVWTFITTLH